MKLTQAPPNTSWEMRIVVGTKLVLINKDSATQVLPAGAPLLGYGKGKWVQKKLGEDHGPEDVPFTLKSDTDKVIYNGQVGGSQTQPPPKCFTITMSRAH